MNRTPKLRVPAGIVPLLLAALCGGCEIEGEGGDEKTRWKLESNLRDPSQRPNPDAELVVADDDATVSIRP